MDPRQVMVLDSHPRNPRQMRILVTGSSGFIARYLIPELAAKGHEIVGVDKREGPDFGRYFHFVFGNILDEDVVFGAMRGTNIVVHLAAEHKDFGVPDRLYEQVNVEGTRTLLRCATECGVDKFVFFSSVAVYGDSLIPTHEELAPSPDSPYGRTKLSAERHIEDWVKEATRRESLIVRPTVVFGPHNYANMYRLISSVANRRYVSVGNGGNTKSVCYVENVTAATLFLMDRMDPGVEIFNYADSPHLTTRELVRCIATNLHIKVPPMRIPKALALTCTLPLDAIAKVTGTDLPLTAKRIRKFTSPTHHLAEKIHARGYQPPYTLESGIRKTVDWYLQSQ